MAIDETKPKINPENYPKPPVPNATRREDWRIGGIQDAAGKVQTVFVGQAKLGEKQEATISDIPEVNRNVGREPENSKTELTPEEKGLAAPLNVHVPVNMGKSDHRLPLIIIGVIIAGAAIFLLWRVASRVQRSSVNSRSSYNGSDPMSWDVAQVPACSVSENQEMSSKLDTEINKYKTEYILEASSEAYEQVFNYFLEPARVTSEVMCLDDPRDCEQEITGKTDLQVRVMANHYAQDKNVAVGQRIPAEEFVGRLASAFGTVRINLVNYSSLDFDSESDTFGVPAPVTGPERYDYTLQEVRLDPEENEIVFIAQMTPRTDCELAITGGRCTCLPGMYYLVMTYDEAVNHWIYARHFTKQEGTIVELTQ